MTLPVAATPAPGEPLDTFLERISYATPTSLGHLHRTFHLNTIKRSFSPAITIPPSSRLMLAQWMGIPPHSIDEHTLLGAYPALTPSTPTPTTRSLITAAHSRWFFVAHSRYCPQCCATQQPWQLDWRLPWSIACAKHRVLLLDACPRCTLNPREHIRGTGPRRDPEEPVDPVLCQRPQHPRTTGRATPRCREPLANAVTQEANTETISAQQTVLTAIRTGTTFLGQPLTHHLALTTAIDVARLTLHGTHTQRRLFPLRHIHDSTTATRTTADVLQAASPSDAADAIRAARSSTPNLTHNDVLAAVTDRDGPLKPVLDLLLSTSGRVSTRIQRRQLYFPVTDANVDQVPLLMWPCITPEVLLNDRRALHYRFLLSLTLAKTITGTWEDAAEGLGFPRAKGRAWSKHLINTTPRKYRALIPDSSHQALALLISAPNQPRAALPTLRHLQDLPQSQCSEVDPAEWCPCACGNKPQGFRTFSSPDLTQRNP